MRRSWLAASACSTSEVSCGSPKACQNAGSASAAVAASAVPSVAADDWMKASGTAMSGRTKSGPTVQADSATVSAADFSSKSVADLWSFMGRSEEHTSELQSLMRISYAVFCLKKKIHHKY